MNICVISGEVVNNGIVRGKERKVLVFTVATKSINGDAEATLSYVPCVVFNPSEELQQVLTTRGKGLSVELQGRVNASRLDVSGEPRASAEVVVYSKTLRVGHAATQPVNGNSHSKPAEPRTGGTRTVADVLRTAVASA